MNTTSVTCFGMRPRYHNKYPCAGDGSTKHECTDGTAGPYPTGLGLSAADVRDDDAALPPSTGSAGPLELASAPPPRWPSSLSPASSEVVCDVASFLALAPPACLDKSIPVRFAMGPAEGDRGAGERSGERAQGDHTLSVLANGNTNQTAQYESADTLACSSIQPSRNWTTEPRGCYRWCLS